MSNKLPIPDLQINGELFDDNWIMKYVSISPAALGNKQIYSYDLIANQYLPDDEYDYEILLGSFVWTTATAGQIVGLWVYTTPCSYNVSDNTTVSGISPFTFRTRLIRARARVAYHACQGASCVIPIIDGGKKLVFWNSDTNTMHSWNFQLYGYRRLGTNI